MPWRPSKLGWAATVVAARADPITTGSIARDGTYRPQAGPRLTGQTHALAGAASYYWQEQMTATGERFDKRAMTAAHKTLPFGTRVRVTRAEPAAASSCASTIAAPLSLDA